jgi:predicted SnoaL-like aldol condensation-catalyzing enzyme
VSDADKAVATAALSDYLARFPAEFVIAQNGLVTVVAHELRGEGDDEYDYFSFHTFRVAEGEIVERWSNTAVGSEPLGSGRRQQGRRAAVVDGGDPAVTTAKVADFYRLVFDGHNADAVADFVTPDYHQHSRHLPQGRDGLQGLVRSLFPDGPVPAPDVANRPPVILMGEGDLVVIAGAMPQPDGAGGEYLRMMYDGYLLRDGLIAEHWSGVDPANPPKYGPS